MSFIYNDSFSLTPLAYQASSNGQADAMAQDANKGLTKIAFNILGFLDSQTRLSVSMAAKGWVIAVRQWRVENARTVEFDLTSSAICHKLKSCDSEPLVLRARNFQDIINAIPENFEDFQLNIYAIELSEANYNDSKKLEDFFDFLINQGLYSAALLTLSLPGFDGPIYEKVAFIMEAFGVSLPDPDTVTPEIWLTMLGNALIPSEKLSMTLKDKLILTEMLLHHFLTRRDCENINLIISSDYLSSSKSFSHLMLEVYRYAYANQLNAVVEALISKGLKSPSIKKQFKAWSDELQCMALNNKPDHFFSNRSRLALFGSMFDGVRAYVEDLTKPHELLLLEGKRAAKRLRVDQDLAKGSKKERFSSNIKRLMQEGFIKNEHKLYFNKISKLVANRNNSDAFQLVIDLEIKLGAKFFLFYYFFTTIDSSARIFDRLDEYRDDYPLVVAMVESALSYEFEQKGWQQKLDDCLIFFPEAFDALYMWAQGLEYVDFSLLMEETQLLEGSDKESVSTQDYIDLNH